MPLLVLSDSPGNAPNTRAPLFVVHGGLADTGLRIADINKWQRAFPVYEETDPCLNLLWSDPKQTVGVSHNERGAGVVFGPDVSRLFVKTNGLSRIIRSHECKDRGADVHHEGSCVTVFSASNYQGHVGNFGATLTVSPDLTVTVHSYWADSTTARQPVSTLCTRLKAGLVEKLRDRIAANVVDLQAEFENVSVPSIIMSLLEVFFILFANFPFNFPSFFPPSIYPPPDRAPVAPGRLHDARDQDPPSRMGQRARLRAGTRARRRALRAARVRAGRL